MRTAVRRDGHHSIPVLGNRRHEEFLRTVRETKGASSFYAPYLTLRTAGTCHSIQIGCPRLRWVVRHKHARSTLARHLARPLHTAKPLAIQRYGPSTAEVTTRLVLAGQAALPQEIFVVQLTDTLHFREIVSFEQSLDMLFGHFLQLGIADF